ncbi:uncharacterized protein Bfra_012008ia [Botrytis fragariae]|uniref:Uncharacterized protein n=1 Tax=Botrytis fragariae TaxID=1964551 RepID=A0A8H6AK04_9HELO|nr:uncharacterized protein Bfra_012008ia [Botrytis fragariae]KAF5868678.1 hypothetical protein Bfra_012008ia [Botrytis fragariae]
MPRFSGRSLSSPNESRKSSQPPVKGHVDQFTEDGNIVSVKADDGTDRKDSTASSIKSVSSVVSFSPKVAVEMEKDTIALRPPIQAPPPANIKNLVPMMNCGLCSKTTMVVESPSLDNLDKRLKTCLEFITKRVNDTTIAKEKNPKWYEKHTSFQKWGQDLEDKSDPRYLFEIRIVMPGRKDANSQEKYNTSFWLPRNWDPATPKSPHVRDIILWHLFGGPFRVYPGHFDCSMNDPDDCHRSCQSTFRTKGLNDFKRVENVEAMTIRMTCRCGSKNELDPRWRVILYKRMTSTEKRKHEEDADLKKFAKTQNSQTSGANVVGNFGINFGASSGGLLECATEDSRQTIEEADRVTQKLEENMNNSKSLVGENALPGITEEANTDTTNEQAKLGIQNSSSIDNESIAFIDFGADKDNNSEEQNRAGEPQPSVLKDESIPPTGTRRNGDEEKENQIQQFESSVVQNESISATSFENSQNSDSDGRDAFQNWQFQD